MLKALSTSAVSVSNSAISETLRVSDLKLDIIFAFLVSYTHACYGILQF